MRIQIASITLLASAFVCASHALTITGYSASINDRFSGGYPLDPVPNTNPSFVGEGYDWSGVGWDASNPQRSFGFLSPRHYIAVRHSPGGSTITLFGGDGQASSFARQSMQNTGYGVPLDPGPDLSLGTLAAPISPTHEIVRYAVLDLNNSSTTDTPSNYVDLPILVYGRGDSGSASPRIGATTVVGAVSSGSEAYFGTTRTEVQLQSGDSSGPVFAAWTNPNGAPELAILGNNSAIDVENGFNFMNFLGTNAVMTQLNAMMNDEGWALRVVGNPTATWGTSHPQRCQFLHRHDLGAFRSSRGEWQYRIVIRRPSRRLVRSLRPRHYKHHIGIRLHRAWNRHGHSHGHRHRRLRRTRLRV